MLLLVQIDENYTRGKRSIQACSSEIRLTHDAVDACASPNAGQSTETGTLRYNAVANGTAWTIIENIGGGH